MQKEKITINGTDYEVGFSCDGIRIFEELAGKSITMQSGFWDNLIYFYATLKGLNDNFKMSFEDFKKYIEKNTNLLIEWQTINVTPDADENTTPLKKNKLSNSLFTLWTLSLFVLGFMVVTPIIFGIGLVPMSFWGIIKLITSIGKKQKP